MLNTRLKDNLQLLLGPPGSIGPRGFKGASGDISGIIGPQGFQGNTNTGNIGNQGNSGIKGLTGPTGSQGNSGEIGPIGPTGYDPAFILYDIITATGSTAIDSNTHLTFIENNQTYSLNGDENSQYYVNDGLDSSDVLSIKNIRLPNNTSGNVRINLIRGSFNLNYTNPLEQLYYLNHRWNSLNKFRFYPTKQLGSITTATGNIGAPFLGHSLALSADYSTLAAGAIGDNTFKGAAFIFIRDNINDTWIQQAKLVPTSTIGSSQMGYSISISANGNVVAVGANNDNSGTGATWVFRRTGTTWDSGTKLIGSSTNTAARQGISVSLSANGNRLAVGSSQDDQAATQAGATFIWNWNGTSWVQTAKLFDAFSGFQYIQGISVRLSADGNILASGAAGVDSFLGATYIWIWNGSSWINSQKIVATGSLSSSDYQGSSISLSPDGTTLAIGAYAYNINKGATWIFASNGDGNWIQQTTEPLVGSGGIGSSSQSGYLGHGVSLSNDGNTLVVGGYEDNSSAGAIWIFTRDGTRWTQQGDKISGPAGSRQGWAMELSKDGRLLVCSGYAYNSNNGGIWTYA